MYIYVCMNNNEIYMNNNAKTLINHHSFCYEFIYNK